MTGQSIDLSFVKYFMAKSVGTLNPKAPITVNADDKIDTVLTLLKQLNIGCALVTNNSGKLIGIFTERDALKKDHVWQNRDITVAEVMTRSPQAEQPTTSIAHIMTLMSDGGFRHIPIIDDDNRPIGLVSVRDILDHFSNCLDDYYDEVTSLARQVKIELSDHSKEPRPEKPTRN